MDEVILNKLLNPLSILPLMFLFLGAGFYAIYNFDNKLKSARLVSFGMISLSFAFMINYFLEDYFHRISLKFIETALYSVSVIFFSISYTTHYRNCAPLKIYISLFSFLMMTSLYFQIFYVSENLRIFCQEIILGTMILIACIYIRKSLARRVDKFVGITYFIISIVMFSRFSIIYLLMDGNIPDNNTSLAVPIIALHVLTAMAVLAGALSLFSLFSVEIITTLREKAKIDPLTGLSNRNGFDEIFNIFYQKAQNENQGFALIILDLDHFKDVNDTYGHAIGDQVLIKLSQLLKKICMGQQIASRLGGEEFAILLPSQEQQEIHFFAESLRAVIEAKLTFRPIKDNITASLGVNIWKNELKLNDFAKLDFFKEADKALYRAKLEGRNRVCFSNSTLETI